MKLTFQLQIEAMHLQISLVISVERVLLLSVWVSGRSAISYSGT